jgi:hypothetical protein
MRCSPGGRREVRRSPRGRREVRRSPRGRLGAQEPWTDLQVHGYREPIKAQRSSLQENVTCVLTAKGGYDGKEKNQR